MSVIENLHSVLVLLIALLVCCTIFVVVFRRRVTSTSYLEEYSIFSKTGVIVKLE